MEKVFFITDTNGGYYSSYSGVFKGILYATGYPTHELALRTLSEDIEDGGTFFIVEAYKK